MKPFSKRYDAFKLDPDVNDLEFKHHVVSSGALWRLGAGRHARQSPSFIIDNDLFGYLIFD